MYYYLRFNIQQLFRFVMFSSWLVLFPLTTWGESSDTARSLVRQAADAAVKKDYRRSSDLLLRARTEAERVTDYEQLFWVYTNLGINQAELLNYADALQNFTQAYQIATQHLDKRKVLSIRNNIAGLYMMNGEKAKALSEYQHIYHDLKRGKDNVFIGGCALNIATLLIDDRQCEKALPFIEEAERLLGRDVENKPSLVALRMDYLLQMGRAEVAYDLVKGVQQKYPDLSVHPDLLLCQARTAQATGRADEAVAAAQRILLTKGGVDLSMKRSVFELLASAYTLLNDFPQALACKDSVVRTADKLSNVTGQKLFEARQIQFDIWQKQQEIDTYRSQHRLELALMLVAVVACAIWCGPCGCRSVIVGSNVVWRHLNWNASRSVVNFCNIAWLTSRLSNKPASALLSSAVVNSCRRPCKRPTAPMPYEISFMRLKRMMCLARRMMPPSSARSVPCDIS